MTALATVADLAGRLGVPEPATGTPKRTQWEDVLDDASDTVRDAVGCTVELTTSTVTLPTPGRAGGGGWLVLALPAVPARSVSAVLDEAGPVDYELADAHTLRVRTSSRRVTVTYLHGWDPIPGELRRWTLVLAASMLQAASTGNLGMAGGISSIRVDDGQVSFAASAAGAGVDLPDQVRARLHAAYGPSLLEVREP